MSNTDAVIALARRHAGHTRVFTFGIGAGASHHLVEGLARAGEGAAELIAPGERIEGKVLRQLGRALTAALTDVRVDWAGLGVEQAPHEVPPVFADGRVLLYGRLEKAESGTVSLRASGAQGDVVLRSRSTRPARRRGASCRPSGRGRPSGTSRRGAPFTTPAAGRGRSGPSPSTTTR